MFLCWRHNFVFAALVTVTTMGRGEAWCPPGVRGGGRVGTSQIVCLSCLELLIMVILVIVAVSHNTVPHIQTYQSQVTALVLGYNKILGVKPACH